jgi:hypothetical protein
LFLANEWLYVVWGQLMIDHISRLPSLPIVSTHDDVLDLLAVREASSLAMNRQSFAASSCSPEPDLLGLSRLPLSR